VVQSRSRHHLLFGLHHRHKLQQCFLHKPKQNQISQGLNPPQIRPHHTVNGIRDPQATIRRGSKRAGRGGEIPPGLLVDGEARKPVILSWVRLSHGRGGVVDFSQTPAPNVLAVAGGPAQAQPPEAEEGAGGERQRERWLVEPCFVERGSVRSRLFLFCLPKAHAISSEREKHPELKAAEAAKPGALSIDAESNGRIFLSRRGHLCCSDLALALVYRN
jgi:hypothetical protein